MNRRGFIGILAGLATTSALFGSPLRLTERRRMFEQDFETVDLPFEEFAEARYKALLGSMSQTREQIIADVIKKQWSKPLSEQSLEEMCKTFMAMPDLPPLHIKPTHATFWVRG